MKAILKRIPSVYIRLLMAAALLVDLGMSVASRNWPASCGLIIALLLLWDRWQLERDVIRMANQHDADVADFIKEHTIPKPPKA